MTLTEISDSMIAAITALGLGFTTVDAISTRSIEQMTGEGLGVAPAALVMIDGLDVDGEIGLTTAVASTVTRVSVLIVAEDLAGGAAADRQAYALIDGVIGALPGTELTGASGKAHLSLESVEAVAIDQAKVIYRIGFRALAHL